METCFADFCLLSLTEDVLCILLFHEVHEGFNGAFFCFSRQKSSSSSTSPSVSHAKLSFSYSFSRARFPPLFLLYAYHPSVFFPSSPLSLSGFFLSCLAISGLGFLPQEASFPLSIYIGLHTRVYTCRLRLWYNYPSISAYVYIYVTTCSCTYKYIESLVASDCTSVVRLSVDASSPGGRNACAYRSDGVVFFRVCFLGMRCWTEDLEHRLARPHASSVDLQHDGRVSAHACGGELCLESSEGHHASDLRLWLHVVALRPRSALLRAALS